MRDAKTVEKRSDGQRVPRLLRDGQMAQKHSRSRYGKTAGIYTPNDGQTSERGPEIARWLREANTVDKWLRQKDQKTPDGQEMAR